jgi:hypothetical protein
MASAWKLRRGVTAFVLAASVVTVFFSRVFPLANAMTQDSVDRSQEKTSESLKAEDLKPADEKQADAKSTDAKATKGKANRLTCCCTPTIPSIGIPGAKNRSKRPKRKAR